MDVLREKPLDLNYPQKYVKLKWVIWILSTDK